MSLRLLGIRAVVLALGVALACGDSDPDAPAPSPGGPAIARTEGTAIEGAPGWTWIPFSNAFCTDATRDELGRYHFGKSATGLAISWGPETSTDVVIFLQGGGACWEFFTCGGVGPLLETTANVGPFGPAKFAQDIHDRYPGSWIRRANLPPSLRDATIVFVPYCTGDVHGGDKVTTYPGVVGVPPVTWHHVGRANVNAFLERLAPTFPSPRKLVVAGASAGGFGSLANYVAFRSRWPGAKGYLVDDSGPPLIGDAIPASTRGAWYESWNMGASLDEFCPGCRSDMSSGLREIVRRYPDDRIALVSHLQDEVIRGFFGGIVLAPQPTLGLMPADQFELELRRLGTTVMDPATPNAKYFFPAGAGHPTLEDPSAVMTPAPGLAAWLELMLSDSPAWASASE